MARPRRGSWPRAIGRWLLRGATALFVVVTLLVAFADTQIGREQARRFFEWAGSSTSRGEVRIGEVVELPPGPLVLRDYQTIAPDGERVLRAEQMSGHFDPTGLLEGQVRFRRSRFVGTEIHLTPGPRGQVNLIYASEVPEDRFTVPLVWEDIELEDNSILVDLPGKPPLAMRDVHGRAHLHIGHRWTWTMHDNHGFIDVPLLEVGFSSMNGRLTSDDPYPLIARTEIDLGVATPRISMDYFAPALAGLEGRPHFAVGFPAEPLGDELAAAGVP